MNAMASWPAFPFFHPSPAAVRTPAQAARSWKWQAQQAEESSSKPTRFLRNQSLNLRLQASGQTSSSSPLATKPVSHRPPAPLISSKCSADCHDPSGKAASLLKSRIMSAMLFSCPLLQAQPQVRGAGERSQGLARCAMTEEHRARGPSLL